MMHKYCPSIRQQKKTRCEYQLNITTSARSLISVRQNQPWNYYGNMQRKEHANSKLCSFCRLKKYKGLKKLVRNTAVVTTAVFSCEFVQMTRKCDNLV